MAMRRYIELYIHDNETNPGKKRLRSSVKSPPLYQKKKKKRVEPILLSARRLRKGFEESLRS